MSSSEDEIPILELSAKYQLHILPGEGKDKSRMLIKTIPIIFPSSERIRAGGAKTTGNIKRGTPKMASSEDSSDDELRNGKINGGTSKNKKEVKLKLKAGDISLLLNDDLSDLSSDDEMETEEIVRSRKIKNKLTDSAQSRALKKSKNRKLYKKDENLPLDTVNLRKNMTPKRNYISLQSPTQKSTKTVSSNTNGVKSSRKQWKERDKGTTWTAMLESDLDCDSDSQTPIKMRLYRTDSESSLNNLDIESENKSPVRKTRPKRRTIIYDSDESVDDARVRTSVKKQLPDVAKSPATPKSVKFSSEQTVTPKKHGVLQSCNNSMNVSPIQRTPHRDRSFCVSKQPTMDIILEESDEPSFPEVPHKRSLHMETEVTDKVQKSVEEFKHTSSQKDKVSVNHSRFNNESAASIENQVHSKQSSRRHVPVIYDSDDELESSSHSAMTEKRTSPRKARMQQLSPTLESPSSQKVSVNNNKIVDRSHTSCRDQTSWRSSRKRVSLKYDSDEYTSLSISPKKHVNASKETKTPRSQQLSPAPTTPSGLKVSLNKSKVIDGSHTSCGDQSSPWRSSRKRILLKYDSDEYESLSSSPRRSLNASKEFKTSRTPRSQQVSPAPMSPSRIKVSVNHGKAVEDNLAAGGNVTPVRRSSRKRAPVAYDSDDIDSSSISCKKSLVSMTEEPRTPRTPRSRQLSSTPATPNKVSVNSSKIVNGSLTYHGYQSSPARSLRKHVPMTHDDDDETDSSSISCKKSLMSASKQPRTPRTPKSLHLSSTPATPSSIKASVRRGLLTPSMPVREHSVATPRTPLQEAMSRLHVSAVPVCLPCREAEFRNIFRFVEGKLLDCAGGCMYISGVPGTGKTATVHEVVRCLQESVKMEEVPQFQFIEVNGMRLTEPRQAYVHILKELNGQKAKAEQAQQALEKIFTRPSSKRVNTIVLLVDELDVLWTRRQDVVYNLLDWPTKSSSQLVVLTIANTMDLPERLLMGRVTSRLGLTRLTFQPYTHKQLQEIVTARLKGLKAFDPDAVQLVARKVASVSGDARRALDICRRATEIAEQEGPGIVTMHHVDVALTEMISSSKMQALRGCSMMELMFLQAVSTEVERTGVEETRFNKVFKMMGALCSLEGITLPSVSQAMKICNSLGSSRLLLTENSKADIQQRILLNISTDDLRYTIKEIK